MPGGHQQPRFRPSLLTTFHCLHYKVLDRARRTQFFFTYPDLKNVKTDHIEFKREIQIMPNSTCQTTRFTCSGQVGNWIWVRSWRCSCLVTWFCYQMIAKPGNKTAAPSWPDSYIPSPVESTHPMSAKNSCNLFFPFMVHTRNLHAMVGVWHILSNNVQWRYNTNWSSCSKANLRLSTERLVSSPSGLKNNSHSLH